MTIKEFKAKGYGITIFRRYTTINTYNSSELRDDLKNMNQDYMTHKDFDYMTVELTDEDSKVITIFDVYEHGAKASVEAAKAIEKL